MFEGTRPLVYGLPRRKEDAMNVLHKQTLQKVFTNYMQRWAKLDARRQKARILK